MLAIGIRYLCGVVGNAPRRPRTGRVAAAPGPGFHGLGGGPF